MLPPTLSRAEFVANPTNSTAPGTTRTDPNYNTYQNLGLGFSIKYFKNMTVSEQTDNRSAFRTTHLIYFYNPHVGSGNFKNIPHLIRIQVMVTTATGTFGIPLSLDDAARQVMLSLINNSTTIISKTKGSLNSLPAYKIELESMVNAVNFTGSTTKILSHTILYLTVKSQLLYVIEFITDDKNIQTNFIPMVNKFIDSFQYN